MRKIIFFVFLLAFLSVNLFAQINYSDNQTFRVYSVDPNLTMEIYFNATATSGTITSVYAKINGSDYTATNVGGNQYKVTWTANSFGTYSLKGVMTMSTNATESTFLTNLKIIEATNCAVPEWNSGVGYGDGSYVSFNDKLYTANYYTQGENPETTDAWTETGICSSQNYPTLNCSTVAEWDTGLVYGPSNNNYDVQYDGIVYHASYWTQNNKPDQGGSWTFVAVCAILNELPQVQSNALNSVNIQSNLNTIPINATITDDDGEISNVEIVIDGVSLSPISNTGNQYSVNWTPTNYGIFSFKIVATDDELGITTKQGTIQVASSIPPVISNVYPSNNITINTIYNINSDVITLSADAIDPDGTITDIHFSLNGQDFQYDNANGNNYTYDWTPTAYGSYNFIVTATDNSGTIGQKIINFNLINPMYESIDIENIPLQIQANLGYDKVFELGENISEVLVRNKELLTATFSGSQMTISANRPGRTGLKITTTSGTYYVGIRINYCDGTIPGMPEYASIGYKSQDITPDLEFWEDLDVDFTNKNMDVRYIYINGGPAVTGTYNSWRDTSRTVKFCTNSLKYGLIPFFVYYNIPDGGESFTTDLAHAQDTAYMKEYFADLNIFIDNCVDVMGDDLFGIILEPDFLGYLQQLGEIHLGTSDPEQIPTCVTATEIAENAGNIRTLVERINKTIDDRRQAGANLFFGWQLNLWSAVGLNGGKGLMRRTDEDDLGWVQGRATIHQAATLTMNYGISCGIISNNADFVSIDKYGLDAEGYSSSGVTTNPWWFSHDHWNNYMMYAKTMHQISGKNMILWQLPVGRINGSHYVSAYTNSVYQDLPNTTSKYEDSTIDYFFGDKFTENDPTRFTHFTNNNAQDTSLEVSGNEITWHEHFSKFNDCGIIHAMFGAGVGNSTDGIGNPPKDDYFSIQKIQDYYYKNLAFLPSAPYTDNTLIFNTNDADQNIHSLYSGSFNFAGYSCTIDGVFSPSTAGVGTFYVTFLIPNGSCKDYKVQKIIVTQNCYVTNDISAEICKGETYEFAGETLNSSGVYSETYQIAGGCDSIVTLTLAVNQVNVDFTQNFNILSASNSNADTYQWLNCDNNNYSVISGANNQDYEVITTGYYAVEVTENSCVDTSNCNFVVITNIENESANNITIYPNPTTGKITVKGNNIQAIEINSINGQNIKSIYNKNNFSDIDLTDYPKGIYIIKIIVQDKIIIEKIILD